RMLSGQFVRNIYIQSHVTRYFTHSSILREIKVDKIPAQKSNESIKDNVLGPLKHLTTNFDKIVLVWVKRYPSIADVPKFVTIDCMHNARTKARIKTCNYMMIFGTICCLSAVFLGKEQAKKGETLFKQREKWLEEYNAEDKKK
ncbi:hypothetical protein ALC53_07531, partial [Atta colombica]